MGTSSSSCLIAAECRHHYPEKKKKKKKNASLNSSISRKGTFNPPSLLRFAFSHAIHARFHETTEKILPNFPRPINSKIQFPFISSAGANHGYSHADEEYPGPWLHVYASVHVPVQRHFVVVVVVEEGEEETRMGRSLVAMG